jgi:uncharacterized protein
MRILISGASGFVGTALVPYLEGAGHTVTRLVRRPPRGPRERAWDPAAGVLDSAVLESADAVINLSGEDLAAGRWTASRKRRLWDSRVQSTNLLASAVALASPRPSVMINASGVGYYGDRGEETLTEDSSPGEGFLPRLAHAWEAAAEPARAAGTRVVSFRFGIVLAAHGGALAKMLTPFRFGAGGPFADGRAWWTWIALDDLLAAMAFAFEHSALDGPVNLVAPEPVRNADFVRALARVLHRPAVMPVPAFALRALLGEMADDALLASTRAVPRRLLDAGFRHRFTELEEALRDALGRPARAAA